MRRLNELSQPQMFLSAAEPGAGTVDPGSSEGGAEPGGEADPGGTVEGGALPVEPGGSGAADPSPVSWLDGCTDADLKSNPSLTKFENPYDLGKSYIELQQKIGMKGVIPPADDAADEDRRAFFSELGCPAKPEELTTPEIPENFPLPENLIDNMKGAAWEAGISQSAWEHLSKAFVAASERDLEQINGQWSQMREQGEAKLREAWGNAYDSKLQSCQTAMAHVFGENHAAVAAMNIMDGAPLGSHPVFIEAFSRLGDQLSEGKMIDGDLGSRLTKTPGEAKRELDTLMADKGFQEAWHDADHPEHKAAVERRATLYQAMEGPEDPSEVKSVGLPFTGGGHVRGPG